MKTTNEFGNVSRIQAKKGQASLVAASLLATVIPQAQADPWDVDQSFDPGSTVNAAVQTIAVTEDGKMLIGGFFSTVHGAMCSGLARLNSDGSLDNSFATKLVDTSTTSWPGVNSLVVQPDGKILVAGSFTSVNGVARRSLARLNPDGTLDDSFLNELPGPEQPDRCWIRCLSLQSDGKVLIGGAFTSVNGAPSTNFLVRLNPDGSLDNSFLANFPNPSDYIRCIAVQTNGQILIGGMFTSVNGTACTNLARLNVSGALDKSFDAGSLASDEGGFVNSLAIQTNGQILVGGFLNSTNSQWKATVMRLNDDGSLDTSFVADMNLFYPPYPLVAVQPDGKILIGGGFTSFNNLARTNLVRLNADGTLDETFSANLYDPRGFQWCINCLTFQSDGKILVSSGPDYDPNPGHCLRRLNTNGSEDPSFNFGPTGPDGEVRHVAPQPDGRILICGDFISVNGISRGGVARLMPDGSLDSNFLDHLSGADGDVRTVALQADGKVLVGGEFSSFNGESHPGVVRLNADGSLDTSFLNGMTGPWGANWFGYVYGIGLQNNGKTIIAGSFSSVNGIARTNIARLNADGSLDSSFTASAAGSLSRVLKLVLQPDGKFLISGYFTSVNGEIRTGIARLNPDGTLDTSFHASVNNPIWTIALQDDGKILIGGWFTTVNGVAVKGIARLNVNGSLDQTFVPGLPGSSYSVYSIALPGDGTILVGGSLSTNGPLAQLARLNPDGSLDSSFPGALLDLGTEVRCVTLQGDGKILIAGTFTAVNQVPRSYIARLLSDYQPPTIQTPPQSQTVGAGSLAAFHVEVTSTARPAYQWLFNTTNAITGVTTDSDLVLTNVQPSQSGDYAVVISSAFGAVTSSPAMLTVTDTAPTILNGPLSQTNWINNTVHFSVSAVGSEPLSYQWFFNETNVITAASPDPNLLLTNVQFSQAGNYNVIVTNAFGAVTSAPAKLDMLWAMVVKNPADSDLRAAIEGGGRAIFACDGTITLSNRLVIGKDTVLDGSGHQITISGGNSIQVFYVNTNVTLTLLNLTVANGRSTDGGGIYIAGGTVNATNCSFVGNLACGTNGADGSYLVQMGGDGRGGAIYNLGTVNVHRCNFVQNSATGGAGGAGVEDMGYGGPGGAGGLASGGAIYNSGFAVINESLFAWNSAVGGVGGRGGFGGWYYGGNGGWGGNGGNSLGSAIFNEGEANIVNCTVAVNQADRGMGGEGGLAGDPGPYGPPAFNGPDGMEGTGFGAIFSTNGILNLTNCTLADNSSTPGSSGGAGVGGLDTIGAVLINTLLSGNSPSNCAGVVFDAGHNISSDGTCFFTSAGSLNNTDPMLGPLADNGGPTLTMALLPGSPAIDAGDNSAAPATDQRGFPRPVGAAPDIGAYECNPPQITTAPPNQTVEAESSVDFIVGTFGDPATGYLWFFNGTNLVASSTNSEWELTNSDFSRSGTYTVVVTNVFGAVTSAPVMLNVIPAVERRPVPAINLTGDTGISLNVEYSDALGPPATWLPLDSVNLTNPPQFWFDLTEPLPPQRFYRVWQTGALGVIPSLNLPGMVPAITLTGNIGDSLRLDCINQFGPTDAWVTLDTVTLTNTSQLYFDTSSIGQPRRLYRIVPEP